MKYISKKVFIAGLILISFIGSTVAYAYVTSQRTETGFPVSSFADDVVTTVTTIIDTVVPSSTPASEVTQSEPKAMAGIADSGQRNTITLAGGCFWCTEAYLQETPGVVSAVSGYIGGSASEAQYKLVSSGDTGHREAVQVVFDPVRISVEEILEVYWKHIDPTDAGGQFADRGFHYTTAIYYHDENQAAIARASKAALEQSGLFTKPIATSIEPYTEFFPAEEYHQDYYKKASAHYERYKKASGRAGFIEDNWAKAAALEFFNSDTTSQGDSGVPSVPPTVMYQKRTWTTTEIAAAQAKLSVERYEILVRSGTEPKDTNEHNKNFAPGIYVDVITGDPLFSSTHKYESGSGWPAFWQSIDGAPIELKKDFKLIIPRTEVRSPGGHLGHVFTDGPEDKGGKRYCINSLALRFVPQADMASQGYSDYLYLFE